MATAQKAAAFAVAYGLLGRNGVLSFAGLAPVSPNPVRGAARFQYALPHESHVHLSVHDIQGRELFVLADGTYPVGRHAVDWPGVGRAALDPGLYFVRLRVSGQTIVHRFVLMR